MKLRATEIIEILQKNLGVNVGRHLYAVLGTYESLEQFSKTVLPHVKDDGTPFPKPVSINHVLIESFDTEELQDVISKESRRPQNTQARLNNALEAFLRKSLEIEDFLILQHCELIFAYSLDVSKLRLAASNQKHLLILLPGEMRGNQIYLFHEAASDEVLKFDNQLFAENNIWELADE
ncbi:MAG: hypothetical protein JEZ06_19450 [Anaerolineaceae bacterium]|nr:hypothetical protein [Anaerolineaceae bacterium]